MENSIDRAALWTDKLWRKNHFVEGMDHKTLGRNSRTQVGATHSSIFHSTVHVSDLLFENRDRNHWQGFRLLESTSSATVVARNVLPSYAYT